MARHLGLDVGDKRIGVALSDSLGMIASPHSVYNRIGFAPDIAHFKALSQQTGAESIVVGLPLNMDGSQGFQAEKVMTFVQKLNEAGLITQLWDERLTSVSAHRVLSSGGLDGRQQKASVDKVAAAIILQAYLDHQSHKTNGASAPEGGFPMADKNNKPAQVEVDIDDDEIEIIELVDEEGVASEFQYLTTIPYGDSNYVVLMAPETEDTNDDEEGEVLILKIEEGEDGEETYVSCEDEEVMQGVFDLFVQMVEDEAEDEE